MLPTWLDVAKSILWLMIYSEGALFSPLFSTGKVRLAPIDEDVHRNDMMFSFSRARTRIDPQGVICLSPSAGSGRANCDMLFFSSVRPERYSVTAPGVYAFKKQPDPAGHLPPRPPGVTSPPSSKPGELLRGRRDVGSMATDGCGSLCGDGSERKGGRTAGFL